MTREEIDQLCAGTDMDAAVAQVLGLIVTEKNRKSCWVRETDDGPSTLFPVSMDDAWAIRALERWRKKYHGGPRYQITCNGNATGPTFFVVIRLPMGFHGQEGDLAPSICSAILHADSDARKTYG